MLWSPYFAISPLFGLYVTDRIDNGSLEIAALSYSMYLVTRVFFEMISGLGLKRTSNNTKMMVVIGGIAISALGLAGFAYASTVFQLYLFYSIVGAGTGISCPLKNTLFSLYLDKGKETEEWAVYDSVVILAAAAFTAVSGVIANEFGYSVFFFLSAITVALGIGPYIYYWNHFKLIKTTNL